MGTEFSFRSVAKVRILAREMCIGICVNYTENIHTESNEYKGFIVTQYTT